MAKTKESLEMEIALLQTRLMNSRVDPRFTPQELVRWDPTLIGTVLRMQHYIDIPISSLGSIYGPSVESNTPPSDINLYSICPRTSSSQQIDRRLEAFAVLVPSGLKVLSGIQHAHAWNFTNQYSITNDIESMAKYIRIWPGVYPGAIPASTKLSCKDLDITLVKGGVYGTELPFYILHVPLTNPHQFILDQIFITTPINCFDDKERTIDRYPLSILYNEWKEDSLRGGIFYRKNQTTDILEMKKELIMMREAFGKLKEERDNALDLSRRFQNALHVATLGADPK